MLLIYYPKTPKDTTKVKRKKTQTTPSKLTWSGTTSKRKGVWMDKGVTESREEDDTMRHKHLQRNYNENPENRSGTPKISRNGQKLPKPGGNPDSGGIRSDRKWVSGQRPSKVVRKLRFPVSYISGPKSANRDPVS
jgi:hypothetical protein